MTSRTCTEPGCDRPHTDRFWEKVDTTGDCWLWTACRNPQGYGQFSVHRRGVQAHRYAYETMVGPIPVGLTLDHLCRNRACVNPAHLEPVTQGENVRRAVALLTHCKRGHEFTPENTRMNGGKRTCRECARYRRRRWRGIPPERWRVA